MPEISGKGIENTSQGKVLRIPRVFNLSERPTLGLDQDGHNSGQEFCSWRGSQYGCDGEVDTVEESAPVVERVVDGGNTDTLASATPDVPQEGFPRPFKRTTLRPLAKERLKGASFPENRKEFAQESAERIESMTREEIHEAQTELREVLGEALVESFLERLRLKDRKASQPKTCLASSSKSTSSSPAFQFSHREAEKLRWTTEVGIESIEEKDSGGNFLKTCRFGLNGYPCDIHDDVSKHAKGCDVAVLHHHGMRADLPGYTLDEVVNFWLPSSNSRQRVAALGLIRNILCCAQSFPMSAEATSQKVRFFGLNSAKWERILFEDLEIHWKVFNCLNTTNLSGLHAAFQTLAEILDPGRDLLKSGWDVSSEMCHTSILSGSPRLSVHSWPTASRRLLTDEQQGKLGREAPRQIDLDESVYLMLNYNQERSLAASSDVPVLAQYDVIYQLVMNELSRYEGGDEESPWCQSVSMAVDKGFRAFQDDYEFSNACLRVLTALCRHSEETGFRAVWSSEPILKAVDHWSKHCLTPNTAAEDDTKLRSRLLQLQHFQFFESAATVGTSSRFTALFREGSAAHSVLSNAVPLARQALMLVPDLNKNRSHDSLPFDRLAWLLSAKSLTLLTAWHRSGWWIDDTAAFFEPLCEGMQYVDHLVNKLNDEERQIVYGWLTSLTLYLTEVVTVENVNSILALTVPLLSHLAKMLSSTNGFWSDYVCLQWTACLMRLSRHCTNVALSSWEMRVGKDPLQHHSSHWAMSQLNHLLLQLFPNNLITLCNRITDVVLRLLVGLEEGVESLFEQSKDQGALSLYLPHLCLNCRGLNLLVSFQVAAELMFLYKTLSVSAALLPSNNKVDIVDDINRISNCMAQLACATTDVAVKVSALIQSRLVKAFFEDIRFFVAKNFVRSPSFCGSGVVSSALLASFQILYCGINKIHKLEAQSRWCSLLHALRCAASSEHLEAAFGVLAKREEETWIGSVADATVAYACGFVEPLPKGRIHWIVNNPLDCLLIALAQQIDAPTEKSTVDPQTLAKSEFVEQVFGSCNSLQLLWFLNRGFGREDCNESCAGWTVCAEHVFNCVKRTTEPEGTNAPQKCRAAEDKLVELISTMTADYKRCFGSLTCALCIQWKSKIAWLFGWPKFVPSNYKTFWNDEELLNLVRRGLDYPKLLENVPEPPTA